MMEYMSSQQTNKFYVNLPFHNWIDMDKNSLLKVFPEEIWKVILERTKHLKSLENLSKSSSFFYHRLLSRQTMFLFPGVFECLMKMNQEDPQLFPKKKVNRYRYNVKDQASEFPWFLRLVCVEWNKSIEAYFETPEVNPLPNGTREIYLDSTEQNYASEQELTQLLGKFGHLLEKVNLNLNFEEAGNLAEYYLLFVKFLRYLPHLKNLSIKCGARQNDNITNNQLTQVIEMNMCPKMEQLKYLCVKECLPAQIFQELLRQNHDFHELTLSIKNVRRHSFDFLTSLPDLTYLNVAIPEYEDFRRLRHFGRNWKLTKFHVGFKYFTEIRIWREIFDMIQDNWGETLEELSISFPKDSAWPPVGTTCELVLNVTIDERLNGLKKLESVEIYSDCAVGLDFLLNCRETLEDICVIQSGIHQLRNFENNFYRPAKRRQIVEFLDKEHRLRESNIWSLFPKFGCYRSYGILIKRPANQL